jgi:hypothetical protein
MTYWRGAWYHRKSTTPGRAWRNRHTGQVAASPNTPLSKNSRVERTNEHLYGVDEGKARIKRISYLR